MLDPSRAALRGVAAPAAGWPEGAPEADYVRSPAAAAVGRLAAAAGLRMFHFEHRHALELPDDWVLPGREADAEPPEWQMGVLPESKYQSYRHDLLLGSFHPGHRAKWTTHELCHGLVGFAWKPGATPLWHATAARLAELLPVALWYFLDEIGLRRCEPHADAPSLYGAFCRRCEAVAGHVPSDPEPWIRDADRFIEGELGAVARTRRLGRVIPHLHATLDLSSDGLAYAHAHGPRLRSDAFERFAAELAPVGAGRFDDLDAFVERIRSVALAVVEGAPLPVLGDRDRWIRQDLGWRLLQVWHDTDGEARDGLDALVGRLVAGAPFAEIHAGYAGLCEDFYLPEPGEVFAVGYPLAGGGSDAAQLERGLRTAVPLTLELLDDAGADWRGFAAADPSVREPIARRFARYAAHRWPGAVADLAAYEAALGATWWDGVPEILGDGSGLRLADGAVVIRAGRDVVGLAEAVEAGTATGTLVDGAVVVDGGPPEQPCALVVGRDHDEVVLAEVSVATADALESGGDVPPGEAAELRATGLAVPRSWDIG